MLIYRVKFDDGKVLKLPDDCLFEINGGYDFDRKGGHHWPR